MCICLGVFCDVFGFYFYVGVGGGWCYVGVFLDVGWYDEVFV